MSKQVGKSQKRYKPNYFYAILSVSIVLFLFGIFGLLIIYSNNLSNYFKEQIRVSIELQDKHIDSERAQLLAYLKDAEFTKEINYISKEEALKKLQEDSQFEDVIDLIGSNPLYSSFELYLYADYAVPEKFSEIKNSIKTFTCVKNIYHNDDLVTGINTFTEKIGLIVLGLGAFILLVTLTLINSTVRLSMYSQRFIIKNMQLVGARSFFIIKPFLIKGLTNGLVSGIIACLLLIGLVKYGENLLEDLKLLNNPIELLILLGSVIFIGLFISTISTMVAVNKYLKMKLDDLY